MNKTAFRGDKIFSKITENSLCKSNEVLMVGVHVGQLVVNQHHDLVLALGLLLPDVGGDDPLGLLFQSWIAVHLMVKSLSISLYDGLCHREEIFITKLVN